MAQHSLFPAVQMRRREERRYRCSYVVPIRCGMSSERLKELAEYLSEIRVGGCETIVIDASPPDVFRENRRVLRWVARHVAVPGSLMEMRTASDKILIASDEIRYTSEELRAVAALLEIHEVVKPQEYIAPLRWWSGIDGARILVHRAFETLPDDGGTIACRRSALREVIAGREVFIAGDLFVRRCAPAFGSWLGKRAMLADGDLGSPLRASLFFAVVPLALALGLAGGVGAAAVFIAAMAVATTAVAAHGRAGAKRIFPFWLCFFAPLWLAERSVSIYWALARHLTRAPAVPDVAGAEASARPPARAPAP